MKKQTKNSETIRILLKSNEIVPWLRWGREEHWKINEKNEKSKKNNENSGKFQLFHEKQ